MPLAQPLPVSGRLPALVPPTTPRTYLSGFTALNIPAPENTGGDWHPDTALLHPASRFHLAGDEPACFVNTNPIFGAAGVHECAEALRGMGANTSPGAQVWAANHYRAVVELLVKQSCREHPVLDLIAPGDFLDTLEQMSELRLWMNQWQTQLHQGSREASFLQTWRTRYLP